MKIKLDDLTGPEIRELLRVHLANAAEHSPADAVYALDLPALQAPEVTFWSVWEQQDILGCGALVEIGDGLGEIKSMHTFKHHRGKGVASFMMENIIAEAKGRGYQSISLETGTSPAYDAAHVLYRKYGFKDCEPFGAYQKTPHSLCMQLRLT